MTRTGITKVVAAVVIVTVGGYLAVQWINRNLNPVYIARQCERRLKETMDPGTLQSWATNLLERYPVGRTNINGPFEAPAGLKHIWEKKRPSAYIKGGYYGEEPYVHIFWGGGGAGYWGFSVGSPTFVPSNPYHGSRMWKPGIYFYEDFR